MAQQAVEDWFRTKRGKALSNRIVKNLAETFISTDLINPIGKKPDELFRDIIEHLGKFTRTKGDVGIIIDHTGDLLKTARQYARDKDENLAAVFYATWVEHKVNDILIAAAKRKRMPKEDIEQIIRRNAIRDKVTWVFRLLDLRPIPTAHIKRINRIEEHRNAFIHYKWKPEFEDKKPVPLAFDDFEKTVYYLGRYQNRHVYLNSKRAIAQVLANGA